MSKLTIIPTRGGCFGCAAKDSDGNCKIYGTRAEALECLAISTRFEQLMYALEHLCSSDKASSVTAVCTAYNGLKQALDTAVPRR